MAQSERLRGKAALSSVQVKYGASFISRVYNAYVYALRLPLPLFSLIMLSSPFLLGTVFTGFYLLDVEGLYIPEDHALGRRDQWEVLQHAGVDAKLLKIFIFSLSLSTTFGGTRVEARSPYALLLANLNTLMAQLIFVVLSGAVFHRLSQPAEPVRWSKVALITTDQFMEFAAKNQPPDHKTYKSFVIRLNLTGPKELILIDSKFELIYRRFLTSPGQLSPFITHVRLKLVRPEASYLKYGFIIRHIIDELSPLHGANLETFMAEDASFTVTLSGLERSSMQPVFSESLYTTFDGDVLWDREFEDQILMDKYGRHVFDIKRLDRLKPIDGESHEGS